MLKQAFGGVFIVMRLDTRILVGAHAWLSFVSQRLSVATQLAAAQEVAEALGLSVAADPRLQ